MAKQFLVNECDILKLMDNLFEITGSEVSHIKVLRKNINDSIIINNCKYIIKSISKENITVEYIEKLVDKGVPKINLTVYQAYLKNDKMEFLTQKLVELGCKNITPFLSTNCVVKLDEKDKLKKQSKLQVVVKEAIKQCGRTDEVCINNILNFNDMLNTISKHEICYIAYEKETVKLKESFINNVNDVAIIIGPEGGFDIKEIEKLLKVHNVKSISLGDRILRAETAAINLTSIIMYELEYNY